MRCWPGARKAACSASSSARSRTDRDSRLTVALITHPACLEHDTGTWHPECPDRLRAVLRALEGEAFPAVAARASAAGDRGAAHPRPPRRLRRRHPRDPSGPGRDRAARRRYHHERAARADAALRAAGGAVCGVDAVMEGWARPPSPPSGRPAITAEPAGRWVSACSPTPPSPRAHAQARWGLRRVAVVDFDVHHGNGTQEIFVADPDLFYGSSHQLPCYPGTGAAAETRRAGNVVNVPLPPGSGERRLPRRLGRRVILPALDPFAPEIADRLGRVRRAQGRPARAAAAGDGRFRAG